MAKNVHSLEKKEWSNLFPGVKISNLPSPSVIFWRALKSIKGPDFLISLMAPIMVQISPQILRALRARILLILRARKQIGGPLARGPALF